MPLIRLKEGRESGVYPLVGYVTATSVVGVTMQVAKAAIASGDFESGKEPRPKKAEERPTTGDEVRPPRKRRRAQGE
jgi:hypothetical protein